MSNKRINVSILTKEKIDDLCDYLDLNRPSIIQTAIAIALNKHLLKTEDKYQGKQWTIAEGIIKDDVFLLFNAILIQKYNQELSNAKIHKLIEVYVEKGVDILYDNYQQKSTLEDFRLTIVNARI